MQDTFIKMVAEHFQFLLDEYGFKIVKIQDQVQYDAKMEGYTEFESSTMYVIITGEWYWNGVAFGRVKDGRKFPLSSELVHEYLSLTAEEKGLACSTLPKDRYAAGLLLNSHKLLHEKVEGVTKVEQTNRQLADHARWLRQYAEPFLRGDFSRWLDIYEYKVARMVGEQKRSGSKEWALRYVGKDENGKPIHVKAHVFQMSFDYLETLRKEG